MQQQEVEKTKDEAFLERLKQTKKVSGIGDFCDFAVQLEDEDSSKLKITLDVPEYLQEAVPGKFIWWSPCKLVCNKEMATLIDFDDIINLAVYAENVPNEIIHSSLVGHCFLSSELKVCTGDATREFVAYNKPTYVDTLLYGRLNICSRVLRFGHRKSNTNNVYNTYSSIFNNNLDRMRHYHVVNVEQAEQYAKNNAVQLVRYV